VWDAVAGRELRRMTVHDGEVVALAFTPDGRTLASGGDGATLRLWEVASGRERRPLTGHSGGVRGVAFSPDGKNLAAAGGDGTARLWDVNAPASPGRRGGELSGG